MIGDYIRQIVGEQPLQAFTATVSEVDSAALTCTLQPVDGSAAFYDSPLQVVTGVQEGWVMIPRNGSYVLGIMTSKNTASVFSTQDVEKALLYADRVHIGGPEGSAAVLGEQLNENLEQLINAVKDIATELAQLATVQAAASVGPLAALAPGFSALLESATTLSVQLEALKPGLNDHISQKVTVI